MKRRIAALFYFAILTPRRRSEDLEAASAPVLREHADYHHAVALMKRLCASCSLRVAHSRFSARLSNVSQLK